MRFGNVRLGRPGLIAGEGGVEVGCLGVLGRC
jgi:hypothetical protein